MAEVGLLNEVHVSLGKKFSMSQVDEALEFWFRYPPKNNLEKADKHMYLKICEELKSLPDNLNKIQLEI